MMAAFLITHSVKIPSTAIRKLYFAAKLLLTQANYGLVLIMSDVTYFTHTITADQLDAFEALTELPNVILNVADGDTTDSWELTWWSDTPTTQTMLTSSLQKVAATNQLKLNIDFQPAPADWQAQQQAEFAPLDLKPFYVCYNDEQQIPANRISLKIPAAMAFGTGKHATTAGCLSLLNHWTEQHGSNGKVLDLGCGSGILAIAAAKLGFANIVASDIETESVLATKENAQTNHVSECVVALASDGFSHPEMTQRGPYQLIMANILANPLQELAPQIVDHLASGGGLILSGFLDTQIADIEADYQALGLTVQKTFTQEEWRALLLQKQ